LDAVSRLPAVEDGSETVELGNVDVSVVKLDVVVVERLELVAKVIDKFPLLVEIVSADGVGEPKAGSSGTGIIVTRSGVDGAPLGRLGIQSA
jgi:hypothetical protein